MKTILVVDDMPIFRDPIAAILRSEGYRTITASNGAEALEMVAAELPDLVLLDLRMPVMDGLSALVAWRSEPATRELPVIVLTALSNKDKVLQAAKLGVHDYMLKSKFSLVDLKERVRRRLADGFCGAPAKAAAATSVQGAHRPASPPPPCSPASPRLSCNHGENAAAQAAVPRCASGAGSLPQLLTRKAAVLRATKALEGSSLSGVVAQVISLAMSPRTDVSQLAGMIAHDPILSAKVLRAANSVAYATRSGPKTSLSEAVRNIGASTVRNIAAALGIFEAMPKTAADGYNPIRCWQHSFAVARLCEHFASQGQPDSTGTAYLVGLCHDLGDIMFQAQFGQEYAQVLECEARTGRTRQELEKAMLGLTRGELVVSILEHLGLPESIQRPIEAHHQKVEWPPSASSGLMVRLLHLADVYANGIQLASGKQAIVAAMTGEDCRSATGQELPQLPNAELLRAEVMTLTATLAGLSAREQTELISPLYPLTDRRACLVRDASLSPCDPLANAVGSMVRVTTADQVPPVDRLKEFQLLIVESSSSSAPGLGLGVLTNLQAACSAQGLRLVWLVRRIEAADANGSLTPLPWPITLERLAEVLGVADAQRQPRAA